MKSALNDEELTIFVHSYLDYEAGSESLPVLTESKMDNILLFTVLFQALPKKRLLPGYKKGLESQRIFSNETSREIELLLCTRLRRSSRISIFRDHRGIKVVLLYIATEGFKNTSI